MNLALHVADDCLARHDVRVLGDGARTLVFGPGFGCDQNAWAPVAQSLARSHRVVLMDFVPARHDSLHGHADDLLEVLAALQADNVVYVGHSVAASIGLLAAVQAPARFSSLALLCASPCYLNEPPHYAGGFSREQIDGLLELMERNFVDWSNTVGPLAFGEFNAENFAGDFSRRLRRQDPAALRRFMAATLLSDIRAELPRCAVPALVLQNPYDDFVPAGATRHLVDSLPSATLRLLDASGHCPHVTHPAQVARALHAFLSA